MRKAEKRLTKLKKKTEEKRKTKQFISDLRKSVKIKDYFLYWR